MNSSETWSSLFNHSSFFCLLKNEKRTLSEDDILSRLNYPQIDNFHPDRKNEFLLGRLCASKAHQIRSGEELLSLPINLNRSPEWPTEVIGSITHNQYWVGAAVSESKSLLGIGIDFEVLGRTKMALGRYIRSTEDLKTHQSLNECELLTIIFSAKESLYKALYPTAKCYFGFDAAAVREINLSSGIFKIDLISEIAPLLGPTGKFHFEGRLKIIGKNCLTVLEIPN